MVLNRVFLHTVDSVPRVRKMCVEPPDMLVIASVLCLLVVCSSSFVFAGIQFFKNNSAEPETSNTSSEIGKSGGEASGHSTDTTNRAGEQQTLRILSQCLTVPVVFLLVLITVVAIYFFTWALMDVAMARDPGISAIVYEQQSATGVFQALFLWFVFIGVLIPGIRLGLGH